MIMTKGKMINKLKEAGVRRTPEGKKLELVKTFEIINLYCNVFGGFKD